MWVFLGGRIVRGKTLYNTVFAIYISLISSITCMHLCNALLKIKSRHTKVLYNSVLPRSNYILRHYVSISMIRTLEFNTIYCHL